MRWRSEAMSAIGSVGSPASAAADGEVSGAGASSRGLRLASRTRLAACLSSSAPPLAAAICSSAGRLATAAAALSETAPDFTAATSSAVACFWMRSIMPTWLLDSLAARASASRVSMGSGSGCAAAGAGSAAASAAALGDAASGAGWRRRSATISRLRSASTPRWKSDRLRRPRCWSIIQRCTSSIERKRVFCTVWKGSSCLRQMP